VVTYEERVLDALGDPTRRAVLKRLRGGARSVGEIAEGMEVSRPAVSQHLKILKTARLVTVHAEGTRRVYAVDARGIEALRDWLDGFWNEALMAFKEVAEEEATEDSAGRSVSVLILSQAFPAIITQRFCRCTRRMR
jgi:DNA-binding transcriptional ArsR family regulator